MNAFEHVTAALLQRQGYWTWINHKVELTPDEKRRIARPSCPRWEIDVVAYKPATNELLLVECKSYIDSRGVAAPDVILGGGSARYKLFTDPTLREVVTGAAVRGLRDLGMCLPSPTAVLCLAAGRIISGADRRQLAEHFADAGWRLFDESWFREGLLHLAASPYENEAASVVTKLLLRDAPK